MPVEEIRCIVRGKVQGVMYRDFAERAAKALDICGTVTNKDDGTVEIIAQGIPENLRAFIERLHEGSILARVDDVSVEWRTPKHMFDEFSTIY